MLDIRRYVIIGNGIAGTGCAETLRKLDPTCQITLLAEEPYPLYNRVSLPPFLKLQAPESKVLMRNRERHEQNRIDLRLETRVTHVCVAERTVVTHTGKEVPYDALLVPGGAWPTAPVCAAWHGRRARLYACSAPSWPRRPRSPSRVVATRPRGSS